LPRRKAERQRRVAELSEEERTTILFESPARLRDTLIALAAVAPDREAVIARELTKLHEEVIRGTVAQLAESFADDTVRGEIVLVLHGAAASRAEVSAELLARRARDLMNEGVDRKEALTTVAREMSVPRRAVFEALLEEGESRS
ncbi:MAG TPA: SAM-dependent methyltransferase, partial [Actinomycetota bacterium]|nr:SAM-dependent methyltransferase [Actinomycetota bacterium]